MVIHIGLWVTLVYTLLICRYLHRKNLLKADATVLQLICINILTAACGDISGLVLFAILVVLCIHYGSLKSPWIPIQHRAVLITGCDSGIGFNLALHLDRLGFQVFAACLQKGGPGEERLLQCSSKNLTSLQLDVTDENQIKIAFDVLKEQLGDKALWGIVNNAGICYLGNIEVMTTEDIHKIVSVNYLGPVNICKYFLPLLRKSQGRLVNISSNAGMAPIPMMGVYCASKSALAIMSEVWRSELSTWGIKVSTIIPSGYKTGIIGYDKQATAERWWKEAGDDVKKTYGEESFNIQFKFKSFEKQQNEDLSHLINCITDALLSEAPQPFYYSGILSRLIPFIYLHSPTVIGDYLMSILGAWFDFRPKASKIN